MKTYEYYAEILEDGHLSIPENIRDEVKAKAETKIKVILMFDDEEKAWDAITMSQFLKGYSDKDAIYDNL
jgi:cupin superfamily acireductone dioxygenase involved in methionine salvage